MIRLCIVLGVMVFAAPALAQQRPPTLAEMQGVAAALSAQLEAARNMHIQSEAKAAALADENTKLKAEIETMKKAAAQQPASEGN